VPWIAGAFVLIVLGAVVVAAGVNQSSSDSKLKVNWSSPSVSVLVGAGGNLTLPITLTSQGNLTGINIEAVPALAPFLTIQPASFSSVSSGQTRQLSLVFSVATNSPLGIYNGTVHVRMGNRTIPQPLEVTLTITTNPLSILIPPTFQLNGQISALGGPVNLNNFDNNYMHGGFVPAGGADIDITSVPMPQIALGDFITNELQGAVITSSSSVAVAGRQADEVFYTDNFGPALSYRNVAVYVPLGERLHKIYLTYQAGDTQESQFLSAFQQLISTIQFTP